MHSEASTRTEPAVCFGCAQQCGVLVQVENERVTAVSGDKSHPTSAGFICPKGTGAHVLHNDASRIDVPLKRIGERGGGEWQETTWDEALDEIAEKISRLTESFGRETLAYSYGTLHGADSGIGERFMHLFDSPNAVGQDKVCYGPNALGEALTYGFGTTFYTNPVPGKTRCIVLWGFRPSASMPLMWGRIASARREGAKLIVIDPERTHEADVADLWLQIRPGSDVALALSLIQSIVSQDLHDTDFVEEHTTGFDALVERSLDYPPSIGAQHTWVPEQDIVAAAQMIARDGPTLVQGGNGLCQSGSTAVQSARAISCLISITGNLGVEGAHALAGPPRDIVANGEAVLAGALSDAQRDKRLGAERFATIGPGYRALDDAMSRKWYGKRHILSWLTSGHEPTLWDAITKEDPYPVKALIVQGHNAVGACADASSAIEALASQNLEL
ncbi:MAG: molybdopterin-containing oxidoreductase family protein, partial [Gaiellaceae bacterium]